MFPSTSVFYRQHVPVHPCSTSPTGPCVPCLDTYTTSLQEILGEKHSSPDFGGFFPLNRFQCIITDYDYYYR